MNAGEIARGTLRRFTSSVWVGFLAFTMGQFAIWQAAPLAFDAMVMAGPSSYEVVQDIVHGFDVTSIFTSPWWAVPFGLIWYAPMYAATQPRGLLMPFIFGAFIQIYLWLVFLREGEVFGFLSAFRYIGLGGGADILPALLQLALALLGLFGGPILAAIVMASMMRGK